VQEIRKQRQETGMAKPRPAGETKEQEGNGSGVRDRYSWKNIETLPGCADMASGGPRHSRS